MTQMRRIGREHENDLVAELSERSGRRSATCSRHRGRRTTSIPRCTPAIARRAAEAPPIRGIDSMVQHKDCASRSTSATIVLHVNGTAIEEDA